MTVLYDEGYADFFDALDALRRAVVRIESESMPRPLYADGTPVHCMDRVEWRGKTVNVASIEWTGDREGGRPHWFVWFYDPEADKECKEPWCDCCGEPLRRCPR